MPSTTRLAAFACAVLILVVTGCANDQKSTSSRPRESAIPWNRPKSWEGPGVYGSALGGQ